MLKTGLKNLKEPVVFKTGLSEMKNLTNLWTFPVPTLYADLNCNFSYFGNQLAKAGRETDRDPNS